jgi:hypothetical protein
MFGGLLPPEHDLPRHRPFLEEEGQWPSVEFRQRLKLAQLGVALSTFELGDGRYAYPRALVYLLQSQAHLVSCVFESLCDRHWLPLSHFTIAF